MVISNEKLYFVLVQVEIGKIPDKMFAEIVK
jgi:hypothetical protein